MREIFFLYFVSIYPSIHKYLQYKHIKAVKVNLVSKHVTVFSLMMFDSNLIALDSKELVVSVLSYHIHGFLCLLYS